MTIIIIILKNDSNLGIVRILYTEEMKATYLTVFSINEMIYIKF